MARRPRRTHIAAQTSLRGENILLDLQDAGP